MRKRGMVDEEDREKQDGWRGQKEKESYDDEEG